MAKRLGQLLTEHTALELDGLERALRLQGGSRERIGALLVQLGMVAERDVAKALSDQLGIDIAGREDYPEIPILQDRVTPEFLEHSKMVALSESDEAIVVAMADPLDQYAIDAVQLATGKNVSRVVGVVSDVETALNRQFGNGSGSLEAVTPGAEGEFSDADLDDIQHLKDLASAAPVIRFVNVLISRALEMRASDIHFEPFHRALKVRFRVDGMLREVEAPPARSAAAVISRIKVMANLNIAERRLPQDGRLKLRIEGREVDVRVATLPTLHGESVVLRLLDRGSVPLEFLKLGFTVQSLPPFQAVLERPHGIVLVTGPTGSGKTTTLYAALRCTSSSDRKTVTVEDPVEYELEGINQVQVKPQIGLTFANCLRSILRQDPDLVMIGEMRDLETAEIAVQAALTGHKVFSTLHTNDAASSITRMLDMGVEDYLITSTLNGVLSQRLVRTLCDICKEPYTALAEVVTGLELPVDALGEPTQLYRGVGCDACEGTGFQGRTGIHELLCMSDPLRKLILKRADAGSLQNAAVEAGMVTMYQDGAQKALAGLTSIDEVIRVTQQAS